MFLPAICCRSNCSEYEDVYAGLSADIATLIITTMTFTYVHMMTTTTVIMTAILTSRMVMILITIGDDDGSCCGGHDSSC